MVQHFHQSLDSKIEKTSPTLGREATYSSTSRLSRLPSYLTVHMVRFAWRRDIAKKAKIMVRAVHLSLIQLPSVLTNHYCL